MPAPIRRPAPRGVLWTLTDRGVQITVIQSTRPANDSRITHVTSQERKPC